MTKNQDHRNASDSNDGEDESIKHRTNMLFRHDHNAPHSYSGTEMDMGGKHRGSGGRSRSRSRSGSKRRDKKSAPKLSSTTFDEEDPGSDDEDAATIRSGKSVRFDEREMATTIPPPPSEALPPPPPAASQTIRRRCSHTSSASSYSQKAKYSDDYEYSTDSSGVDGTDSITEHSRTRSSIRSSMSQKTSKRGADERSPKKKNYPSPCAKFLKVILWTLLVLIILAGLAWGGIYFGIIDINAFTEEPVLAITSVAPSTSPDPLIISVSPSTVPSNEPSSLPSFVRTNVPSLEPTSYPSASPSIVPSTSPSWIEYRWEQVGQNITEEMSSTGNKFVRIDMSSDGTCLVAGVVHATTDKENIGNFFRVYKLQQQGSSSLWVEVSAPNMKWTHSQASGQPFALSDNCDKLLLADNSSPGGTMYFIHDFETGDAEIFKGGTNDILLAGSVALNSDADIFAFSMRQGGSYGSYGNGTVAVYQFDSNYTASPKGPIIREVLDGGLSTTFGITFDLSKDGETIAIGASRAEFESGILGRYQVYHYRDSTWEKKGQLLTDFLTRGDYGAGKSVALSGDGNTIAVSASDYNYIHTAIGMARVYRYNQMVNEWYQLGTDFLGEKLSQFGKFLSLSFDGNVVAIGSGITVGSYRMNNYAQVHEWVNDEIWVQRGGDFKPHTNSASRDVRLSDDGRILAIGGFMSDPSIQDNRTTFVQVFEWTGIPHS